VRNTDFKKEGAADCSGEGGGEGRDRGCLRQKMTKGSRISFVSTIRALFLLACERLISEGKGVKQ